MLILYHIKKVLSTVNFGYFKVFHLTNAQPSELLKQFSFHAVSLSFFQLLYFLF